MRLRCSILFLILVSPLLAQSKRPLKFSDADNWRSLVSPQLSRDGRFVAYNVMPQVGDGEYVVRDLRTAKEWRIPTGGGQASALATLPTRVTMPTAAKLAFTADNRLVVLSVSPTKADIENAKKDKKPTPRTALVLLELASGQQTRIDNVRAWSLAENNPAYLVYQPETRPATPPPMPMPMGMRPTKPTTPAKTFGSDLILRNLVDKSERTFPEVVEYLLTKDGKALVYTVSSKMEENNGVYLAVPGNPAHSIGILAGKGRYQKLTWDHKQEQLAFLAEQGETSNTTPRWKVHHWERKSSALSFMMPPVSPLQSLVCLTTMQVPTLTAAKAVELLSATTPGFKNGWLITDRGTLGFSRDGGRLELSAIPAPPESTTTTPSSEPRVEVDIWHWKDEVIQPAQKLRAEMERNRTYRGVFHLKEKKYVQLADETLTDVGLTPDGTFAVGSDDRPYRRLVGVMGIATYSDYYLVDPKEGKRTSLLRKIEGGLNISQGGKFALTFDGKHWHSLALNTGKLVNLTGKLGVAFHVEEHDMPGTPRPHGVMGWTADDKHVLLYDRHDIWQIAPDGSGATNLTGGLGRKGDLSFRNLRMDSEERFINLDKPLLLSCENLHTRDEGFYRLEKGGSPRCLVMAARSFSTPIKAKDADVYLLTAQSFNEVPDLYLTDPDFKEMKRISDTNPQKKDLLWGNAELVRYKSADGVALQGILLKPENFEQGKKYPMVVYIYERLSQNLHRFVSPRPGTSINVSHYVSNGYLVLLPDIAYTVGSPGQSAVKCVLPAISAVADGGYLDEKAIGIQGHSWGGYQIAYMITQTHRFKAASAGAPVSNMVSAYNGIRWGTGVQRQFQYEQTQSRIGGTLWQVPLRFVENSPIFMADRVQTPLLMLHNDQDEAVPWYQGIEYYLSLRRLDKEVYLFNYNGEKHGLTKRVNQKDYSTRMLEFFDHHLKGSSKPAWMDKGVSYQDRVKNAPSGEKP